MSRPGAVAAHREYFGPSYAGESEEKRALLAEVDASCRWPVLFLFASSLLWLLLGTVLALIVSLKLHSPGFLTEWAWLTFGRVRPAHLNAVVYGFASQATIGTAIWLMCRLARVRLTQSGIVIIGAAFWNVGVTIGIFGIFIGDGTSVEWLEMPPYAVPVLFVSYVLMAVWALWAFARRREQNLYVSQWYVMAALFWFPWLYSTATLLIILFPVRGTVQAAINWWFAHNVLGLWFTPVALGAVYYLIPKVTGRPIYSYYLSILGFWSLALFYSWNGIHHLVGGPMPAWLISASIVASVMMVIPVVTVAINHHMTMVGQFHKLKFSPTLRFIVFGAMCYTAVSLQGSSMALRSVSEIAHFTHHTIAHSHLGMYAFFTMVMFGSIYYIVPRLTLREWPSAGLIYFHFWTTAGGILLYVLPLLIGGFLQGIAMNNADIPFLKTVEQTLPYLVNRTVAGFIIASGHVAFAVNFSWIICRHFGPYRAPSPRIMGLPIELAATGSKL